MVAENLIKRDIPLVLNSVCEGRGLTRSELIESLSLKLDYLALRDVEQAVHHVLEKMSHSLSNDERIEVRGFGSFSLHHRPACIARNPKTGESVALPAKFVPHFKPGKELRENVNKGLSIQKNGSFLRL